ncbi:MAG: hypothetical protein LBF00_03565 [Mycoplasmataceae bacterium]|jgi:hypothetical protein|nr:hypothetical protein [Mycoplasmataceae bacterium]
MEDNKNITTQEIMNMTEEQWQEFRHKSWERKRQSYAKDVPDWYLRSQEGFAQYLERRSSKR